MKELTIEEKAKAYDEVLDKAKKLWTNTSSIHDAQVLESLFPELAESEDERIRKELIDFATKANNGVTSILANNYNFNKWLAWLEKQNEQNPDNIDNKFISMRETKPKDISEFLDRLTTVEQEFLWEHIAKIRKLDKEEQKSTGKVKPRFKFGNWVVIDSEVLYIKEVTEDGYLTDEGGLIPFRCDKEAHLWTIQDAKDGDVIADGNLPFIFKKIDANKYSYAYCGISVDDIFKIKSDGESGEWTWMQDIKPATKEQRNLLFQNMKEAGYEWDAEKKELKKIENVSVWSEEDEKMIAALNEYVGHLDLIYEKITIGSDDICARDFREKVQEWLKSLKDRVQPKQQWSKEDERIKNNLLSELTNLSVRKLIEKETENKYVNWLKSLRSQNTWKPSEEMLEALYRAIPENTMAISEDEMLLDKLYQGLKYGRVLSNK